MIFDQSEQNLSAWRSEMHQYEKGKRTKHPFGKTASAVEHVTHEQIKTRECLFNPILQTYQHDHDERHHRATAEQHRAHSLANHLKNTLKYEKNFDIVNLKSNEPYAEHPPQRKLGPIRNAYNVINNQKMPDFYFQNREMRLPQEREKKLLDTHKKDYDIVSNVYNQHHEQRTQQELDREAQQLHDKYWKTHSYDPVYGHFYDAKQEDDFQKERANKEKEHGKDAEKALPPSYVYREPFIADYTKPLTDTLKMLDERNANAKKRFQTKYVVLDEYNKRNLEEEARHEQQVKEHVHFGRILDEKAKEFDIITNAAHRPTRAEELYGKKLQVPSWDVLIKEASRTAQPRPAAIKSGGFA